MEDLSLILAQLGFTANESKVYIALTALGTVTVGKLQKKTGLFAPRVYEALQKLIDKGFVSSFILNKRKNYHVAELGRLSSFFQEKLDLVSQLAIPLAQLSSHREQQPQVEVFIGRNGMKTIAEDELTAKHVSVLWGSPQFRERFTYFRPGYHQRRIKKKVKMRAIFASRHHAYAADFGKLPFTKVRILPYELPLTVIIYGDRFVLTCWSNEIIAIRIIDENLAKEALKQFDNFWKLAKSETKKN